MKFLYTNRAAKQLKDLPISIQKRIIEKMRFYARQLTFEFRHFINHNEVHGKNI